MVIYSNKLKEAWGLKRGGCEGTEIALRTSEDLSVQCTPLLAQGVCNNGLLHSKDLIPRVLMVTPLTKEAVCLPKGHGSQGQ